MNRFACRSRSRRAFTLVELLVVISILAIVSVGSLAVILPAISQQGVSTAALLVQAEISRARDEAVRANAPRGVRLIPEIEGRFRFFDPSQPNGRGLTPAYQRMIALEMGPDYDEGQVRQALPPATPNLLPTSPNSSAIPVAYSDATMLGPYVGGITGDPANGAPVFDKVLWTTIWESKYSLMVPDGMGGYSSGVPQNPTSWYWSVRQGDKIRVGSGEELTIVGPMVIGVNNGNPERFINFGLPSTFNSTPTKEIAGGPNGGLPVREFLIVVQDGDPAFDGIDNDGDGLIDPGFNGVDDIDPATGRTNGLVDEPGELLYGGGEQPRPILTLKLSGANLTPGTIPVALDNHTLGATYTISRGPVPARGARELALPAGVVIDATSWDSLIGPERSRLPYFDPLNRTAQASGYIDIMISPNGQLVQPSAGRITAVASNYPFYHLWISDADDVYPVDAALAPLPILPLPYLRGYTPPNPEVYLRGVPRLVSINTKSGAITTTTLDADFFVNPTTAAAGGNPYSAASRSLYLSLPYRNAEQGVKSNP